MIPLKCTVQVDFEYKVSLIQRHSAFTIEPLSGAFVTSFSESPFS